MEKLLSHLAYLEIESPDVEASASFYADNFGMRIVDRVDGAVYLRCWGDHYRYSLVVTHGPQPRLSRMTWRTESPEALAEAARRVEAAGVSGQWADAGHAHGRAYDFVGPYGHPMRLLWEIERFEAEPEQASIFPDRPEKRSSHAGAPRFLDHVTVASTDVDGFAAWYRDVLGFRLMARTQLDDTNVSVFSVLTTNEKSHDLGVVLDHSTMPGRVNHIAFWVDTHEELLISADVLMENGTPMEYGPGVHGIGEQQYLYFREPSGLRVELNSGGYRNYVPDWEPNTWTPGKGGMNFYRNAPTAMSIYESFPPADGLTATEDGVHPDMVEALTNS
ncbi:VOC family protein [Georgenia thermotolerans]|uniref:Catechol 1,2-dioxygenase n=1 Tax=Georgenia thermotolerans TaxID=527326 RepID=A0A7J5UU05_9MICO|nr:VOC family protein [Georgenia thermotolerans]KAE8765740.1 catechol 1,2-dioxygenase [Georgenia thermotolerans]